MTEKDWMRCIRVFVRHRTSADLVRDVGVPHCRAERVASHPRKLMALHVPGPVYGTVEMDETYIGGQRKNKRLHIRRISPAKRGHGTDKLPIVGLFSRETGQVYVEVEPRKLDMPFVSGFVRRHVAMGSTVCTDGFKMYRGLWGSGYVHRWVDHAGGEMVRGSVHTNNVEGFWGLMKRQMGCIGGMRRDRLHLFVGEIAWRFNHRKCSMHEKERALMKLVLKR